MMIDNAAHLTSLLAESGETFGCSFSVYSGIYIVRHLNDETHVNIRVKQRHFMIM